MKADTPITEFSSVMIQAKPHEQKLPLRLPLFTIAERDNIEEEFLVDGARIFNTESGLAETYSRVDGWISDAGVKQDFEDGYEDRADEYTFINYRGENAEGKSLAEAAGTGMIQFHRSADRVTARFSQMRFADLTGRGEELNDRTIENFNLITDFAIPEQFRPPQNVESENIVQMVRSGEEDAEGAFTGTFRVTAQGAILITSDAGFTGVVFNSGFCAFNTSWEVNHPE